MPVAAKPCNFEFGAVAVVASFDDGIGGFKKQGVKEGAIDVPAGGGDTFTGEPEAGTGKTRMDDGESTKDGITFLFQPFKFDVAAENLVDGGKGRFTRRNGRILDFHLLCSEELDFPSKKE